MLRLNDTLYNLPPISQELVKTLDWAWLIDFGQGNFNQAKAKTEVALLSGWNPHNLVAKALVHQLQGEYNQALSLLEQAFVIESQPDRQLLITVIAYLTTRKKTENLADGFSLSSTNADNNDIWTRRVLKIKPKVTNLGCRLEVNLIQQIATILPCWRTTIAQQTNPQLQEKYKNLILEQLTEQLALYQGKDYYAIAEFLYGCFAELLALSGQFVAGWQLLENLAPAYLDSEKYLETAWYLLCQGDLIIETAPFGKSIVFGYRLIGNNLDFASIKALDRTKIDTASAQQHYLEARQCFQQANALRGEAMAIMRLAYVNAVQQQWYLAACGYEEACNIFLTQGDNLNGIAAAMGYYWSCLQYEDINDELLVNLTENTEWMRKNGTVTFAISWLLVFTAAAKEALLQENGIIISQRLIKVAEVIATQGIELKNIETLVNCRQLWQSCYQVISDFYRQLAIIYAIQNKGELAFTTAEKASVYGLQSQIPLEKQHIDFKQKLNSLIDVKTIAAHLPQETILLSFLINDSFCLGWAISQKGLVKTNLIKNSEIKINNQESFSKIISLWVKNLLETNPEPKINRILEQILLKPFTQEIESHKHLVIAQCDRFQGLPFAALNYNYHAQSHLLKKSVILGENKTISYLLNPSQISNLVKVQRNSDKIIILTQERKAQYWGTNTNFADFDSLSLSRGLALTLAELYNAHLFHNVDKLPSEVINIIQFNPIINLFLSEQNTLFEQLIQQPLTNDLVLLNIRDLKLRQLPNKSLVNIVQNILHTGVKTVIAIFEGEDSLATAILTSFLYQGLYFGQSLAEALRQAQRQLSLITAQEALDFCHYLQSHIAWQTDQERALRALITKHTGDIMVLGKDYCRATEAYGVAIKILKDVGYEIQAQSLQNKYKMFKSLKNISQSFEAERLIFDAPAYWNTAYIYGDWQLSFTKL